MEQTNRTPHTIPHMPCAGVPGYVCVCVELAGAHARRNAPIVSQGRQNNQHSSTIVNCFIAVRLYGACSTINRARRSHKGLLLDQLLFELLLGGFCFGGLSDGAVGIRIKRTKSLHKLLDIF